jgi:hypothetical protein
MKIIPLLLVLVAVWAMPVPAAARVDAAAQRVLPCGLRVSHEDISAYHDLKCLTGTAIAVSARAMRVQPTRGPVRHLRFTDETQFETNSGEGALNGLVVRDRVCVAYTSAAQTLTARVVAFSPRSGPCTLSKRSTAGSNDG